MIGQTLIMSTAVMTDSNDNDDGDDYDDGE